MWTSKKEGLIWWCVGVLITLAFVTVASLRIDTDFGWHLKTGQLILDLGRVPKLDPFSYTMPSFEYVDHAWFSDVAWAWLYPRIGQVGLGIIYGLMVGATIVIAVYPKFNIKTVLPVLLAAPMFFLRFGVRTQVVDWLMFAIFLRVLDKQKIKGQFVFLVLILWLWANLHGGFVVGLVIWMTKILSEFITKRKLQFGEFIAWILAIFMSLVNPYGLGLWREVYMTLWGNQMRLYIMEWMPALFNFEPAFVFAGVMMIFGLIRYRYRIGFWKILIAIFLVAQSLMSTRHVALFGVFLLFGWSEIVNKFQTELFLDNLSKYRGKVFYGVLLLIAMIMAVWVMGNFLVGVIRDPDRDKFYPVKAVEYLQENPFEGNLYAEYGWGGYLIWKYPQKKTFVDGRMAIWRRNDSPEGESKSAFNDAISIGKGDIEPYFSKYNIKMVLWPKFTSRQGISINLPWNNIFGLNLKSDIKSFEQRLDDLGWKKVYEDDVAVIYKFPE